MKAPKEISTWYAAATFYLTAGFAIPFIIGLIYTFLISPFLVEREILDTIISIILGLGATWLGIMYAARYIKRTYIIKDRKKLINMATSYLVILWLIYWLAIHLFIGAFGLESIVVLIGIAIRGAIFYSLSRFYLKENIASEAITKGNISGNINN
ncbi:MAG: hypothetical protein NTY11_01685 [Candidatus Parcubacteria bacterium]|nr:hypothetical protein [Candidatus Parcubacteria bacterium]